MSGRSALRAVREPIAQGPTAARPPVDSPPSLRRCHAQELDLSALQAVLRASEQGRSEGREQALSEVAQLAARRARRSRAVLALAVLTALFVGFGAGVLVGALAPRPPAGAYPPGD